MARHMLSIFAVISVLSLGLQGVLGAIRCEELPMEVCAFSVSSSGARCVLEKSIMRDGSAVYECQSSVVMAEKMIEWIETDECLSACGVDRMAVGISTDSLVEAGFTRKLCSPDCYSKCPNIVDLYFNLAAGEGIYLPRLCEAHRTRSRRMMEDILSTAKSSITTDTFGALAPSSEAQEVTSAPASSPSVF